MKIIPIKLNKTCDGCTACCSGVLRGDIYGKGFWKGRPCHFVGSNGCSIYDNRPANPCQNYNCGYIQFDWMPEWMRPDKSGVVVSERYLNGIKHLEILEVSGIMRSDVLSFLFMEKFAGQFDNMIYEINGGRNYVGSAEFIAAATNFN